MNVTGMCLCIAIWELPPVTPAAAIRVPKLDFADTRPGEKKHISRSSVRSGRIQQKECGHIEMPYLPDNKLLVVWLKHLLKRNLTEILSLERTI